MKFDMQVNWIDFYFIDTILWILLYSQLIQ